MAIARLLGTTAHLSPLLRRIRRLGYHPPDDLLRLAALRGCMHYSTADSIVNQCYDCGQDRLSNAELAIALVSGGAQGDARHIRVAAQLLGSADVSVDEVSRLARLERCVPILHYIAEAGCRNDSDDPDFWRSLLETLPQTPPVPEGRMPHPSRFMSQPGWTPPSRPPRPATWLRAHG